MQKPDYISDSDAQKMRFVDSIKDVVRENFSVYDAVLFPRRVIGDFAALARWMDRRFAIEENSICVELNCLDLAQLSDDMPGAEKFSADQILNDMRAIQNEPMIVATPKLFVLCRDAGLDDMGVDTNAPGLIQCCYLGSVDAGFRLTDIWRQTKAGVLDPCDQKPAASALPRLVLVG